MHASRVFNVRRNGISANGLNYSHCVRRSTSRQHEAQRTEQSQNPHWLRSSDFGSHLPFDGVHVSEAAVPFTSDLLQDGIDANDEAAYLALGDETRQYNKQNKDVIQHRSSRLPDIFQSEDDFVPSW